MHAFSIVVSLCTSSPTNVIIRIDTVIQYQGLASQVSLYQSVASFVRLLQPSILVWNDRENNIIGMAWTEMNVVHASECLFIPR